MQMKKILIFAVLALVSLQAAAQVEYKASRFGIKSNGLDCRARRRHPRV